MTVRFNVGATSMHCRLAAVSIALTMSTTAGTGRAQCLANRVDNVPLYGQPQIERSAEMKKVDEEFIARALQGISSRERASDAWWSEGERFFGEGNLDFAMRRYNEAWLLNPRAFRPYWGIARVLLECGRVEESRIYFAKAIALVDDKHQEPALLTDSANVSVAVARRANDPEVTRAAFAEADSLYDRVIHLDPEYGNAYKRYAMSLYYQNRFAEAWKYLREAQRRPDVDVPKRFVEALERAMPEPKK